MSLAVTVFVIVIVAVLPLLLMLLLCSNTAAAVVVGSYKQQAPGNLGYENGIFGGESSTTLHMQFSTNLLTNMSEASEKRNEQSNT